MSSTFALNLGSSKTGITDLRADFKESDGDLVSTVSTGFTELGTGQYSLVATVPSGATLVTFRSVSSAFLPTITLAIRALQTIPASGDVDIRNAYLYTRDSAGSVVGGATLYYQQVGADYSGHDAWNDDVQSVVSNGEGLAEIEMAVGSYYRYWIGSGRYRTVHIVETTSDPYPLPQVTG